MVAIENPGWIVNPVAVTIRALTGEPGQMRELQRAFDDTPGYYERTTGLIPKSSFWKSALLP